eukprot:g11591.t1
MKQSSIIRLALFYLVLLISHEGITVATNIRQTVGVRKNMQLSTSLNDMVNMMDSIDIDSFLEVEDMHGMSAEAYGTLEMIEMHKSLKEGFSFEHSPILKDLNSLKEIPENKILSPSELKGHREDVSVLLEKAMSSLGNSKTAASDSKASSSGECKKTTTFSTCGKHSDCRPAKHNPCKGECICDTDGINECECVAKGTTAREELAKIDTGKILDNEETIEKALTIKDVGFSVLFGFVDGFFGGMVTDLKEGWKDDKCQDQGWKDDKCQDRSDINVKFKRVLRKAKHFWHTIKKIHKKVWTSSGRKSLRHALKGLLTALVTALKAVYKFAMACPATKMVGMVLMFIVAMVVFNMAFVAAGFVVVPILIKLVGGLVGLYFSFDYMKDTVIEIYKEMKKMSAEVILLGGLGDFGTLTKNLKATSLLKRYKIKVSPSLIDDIKTVQKSAKNTKDGVATTIKSLNTKLRTKGLMGTVNDVAKKTGDIVVDATKKAGDTIQDVKKTFKKGVKDDIPDAKKKRKTDTERVEDYKKDQKKMEKQKSYDPEKPRVEDAKIEQFGNDMMKDKSFLKRAGLEGKTKGVQDDVKAAFIDAMKKSEDGRAKFVQNNKEGANFMNDPILRAEYWDQDLKNYEDAFKASLKKSKNGITDDMANDFFKNVFTFEGDSLGREWADKFGKLLLGRVTFIRSDAKVIKRLEKMGLVNPYSAGPTTGDAAKTDITEDDVYNNNLKKLKRFGYKLKSHMQRYKIAKGGLNTLEGTKYTLDDRSPKEINAGLQIRYFNLLRGTKEGEGKRFIEAVKKVVRSKEGENRRRRLLNWKNHWEQFTTYVETAKGSCPKSILTGVNVEPNGEFYFSCSQSPKLCKCIKNVGSSGKEQHFLAGNIGLVIFFQDSTVSYEISEDGNPFAYGDVNEGMNERRRRLLQARGGGGS